VQNETGFFPSIGSKTESAHHVSERIEPEVYAGQELSSTITQPIAENPETTELDEGIHKETAAGDISAIENEVHDDDLAAVPETPATTPAESPRKKMYHLIAGSFESAINAESLIEEYSRIQQFWLYARNYRTGIQRVFPCEHCCLFAQRGCT